MPRSTAPVPAVVLASTVRGVDADLRALADEFAASGFIAAAPDLFWRSSTDPSSRGGADARDLRSRLDRIRSGEDDMADTLAHLGRIAEFNGHAVAMGFCYGGPYAILGPRRLGFAAGIACHGTRMLDYVQELSGLASPVCIIWGDQDHLAPAEVLDAYREIPSRMRNVEVHIVPGVRHGFMMPGSPNFDAAARRFSMTRALAILDLLKGK